MLCEGRLLSMTYGEQEELDPPRPPLLSHCDRKPSKDTFAPDSSGPAPLIHHSPMKHADASDTTLELYISPLQSLNPNEAFTGRQSSSEIKIPTQACADGDTPFLVPSFCQSICKNYSDLHIGGDQVLPVSTTEGELRVCAETQPAGPFLQSCDVLPAGEDSLPARASLLHPLRRGSKYWRQGSGRDRSFLFQGREGPFTNSFLNHYLEQKLLDLYQQYMMENMARERGSDSEAGGNCPLLGSEMVLTSLDQITLQLSREGNLEAGLAKDMVLSCLLRVAGDFQSGEISTPLLQISNETSREKLPENTET